MTAGRFALVTGDFVPTGGMDRANYALADYLARSGRAVELVAHRVATELAARREVTAHRVRKPFGSYALGRWPLARAGRRVGRAVAAAGGRVVVNGGNCRFPDVNWVHYVHAAYRPRVAGHPARRAKAAALRPLDLKAERAALRSARVVVCNSDLTRRHAVELCGARPDRTATVYLGTDPDLFRPADPAVRAGLRAGFGWPAGPPVVAFVGALGDRRKGFDTLFAAWTDLARSADWDARLVVVGAGAERAAWEARAEAAGCGGSVQFLGFRTDVPDVLRAADAVVAPTRYEAYGLGVQEALCCGLPAIVSAAAGVAERYPPELSDLLLPDPDDPVDLASRLRHWRADPAAARARVGPLSDALRAYTWDDMSRQFLIAIGEAA